MNNFDENGQNKYYVENGVVHMDVYNLCNVHNNDVIFDEKFLDQIIHRTWRQVQKPGGVYISSWGKKHEPVKHMTLHRLIMQLAGYDIEGKEVDHINGNKFDNRLCNLRVVNHREQMFNLPPTHRNKLGVRGISIDSKSNIHPYKINFSRDGEKIVTKNFSTLPQAVYMRYLLEMYYWDNIAVQRHMPAFEKYIISLSQADKNNIEEYAKTIYQKYPKERQIA